jgi:hypothetical protein
MITPITAPGHDEAEFVPAGHDQAAEVAGEDPDDDCSDHLRVLSGSGRKETAPRGVSSGVRKPPEGGF